MSADDGWDRLEALARLEQRLAEDDAADPGELAEAHAARAALVPTLPVRTGVEHERRLRRLLESNRRSEAALRRRLAATAARMAGERRSHSGARAYVMNSGLNSGGQVPIGVRDHPLAGTGSDR